MLQLKERAKLQSKVVVSQVLIRFKKRWGTQFQEIIPQMASSALGISLFTYIYGTFLITERRLMMTLASYQPTAVSTSMTSSVEVKES